MVDSMPPRAFGGLQIPVLPGSAFSVACVRCWLSCHGLVVFGLSDLGALNVWCKDYIVMLRDIAHLHLAGQIE